MNIIAPFTSLFYPFSPDEVWVKMAPLKSDGWGFIFLPSANPDEDQTGGRATRRKSSKDNFFLMGLFITLDSPDFLVLPYCNWLDSIWDYQLFFCCQGTKMLECFVGQWGEPTIYPRVVHLWRELMSKLFNYVVDPTMQPSLLLSRLQRSKEMFFFWNGEEKHGQQ